MTTKKAKAPPKASVPRWNEVGYEFSIKCKITSVNNGYFNIDIGEGWDTYCFDEDDLRNFLAVNLPTFKKTVLQEQIKETKAKLAQLEKELGEIK